MSLADPVNLDGWTDTAGGLGGAFASVAGDELEFTWPEPVVELSAGRSADEAVLDFHKDFGVRRVVLRRTGEVGSVIFNAVQALYEAKCDLEVKASQATLAQRQAEAECVRLTEQLALARAREFGASSEQKLPDASGNGKEDSVGTAPPADVDPKIKLRLATARSGRKPPAEHLPREEVRYEIPEAERTCKICSGGLVELAPTVTQDVYVVPKRYVVRRHARSNYFCRCCEDYTSAWMPLRLFPGSTYGSPELVADVAASKYQFSIPLNRQVDMAAASGAPLNRTTLANLMINFGDRCTPLHELLREHLLKQKMIHADETPVQVLKEPGRRPEQQSYFWLLRSGSPRAKG